MKDFTLPRRDLEIKLCKCGLLAVILIRTVLFKPVFLQDHAIFEIGSDSIVGIVSTKDFIFLNYRLRLIL